MASLLCICSIERQWGEREDEHIQVKQQPRGRGTHHQVLSLASDQVKQKLQSGLPSKWVPWRGSLTVCVCIFSLSSNIHSDVKRKRFPELFWSPGCRICMLWPVLGLFHHNPHMWSCWSQKYLSHSGGRELCTGVLSQSSPLLFPSDHQISFSLMLLGVVVLYQRRSLAPLIQRQCRSVIYLGKRTVPINNK